MKKFFVSIFFLFGILFTSCDLFPFFEEDELIDLTVFAFSEESVVLKWTTSEANSRFNIYVKDKDGIEKCVEYNYGKKDFFVLSDNKSSYAIGLLVNDKEIYKTNFFYPDLEKGFFGRAFQIVINDDVENSKVLNILSSFIYPILNFFNVPISYVDAALGCKIDVPTIHGDVKVEVPSGIQNGQKLRIKGKGIKDLRSSNMGDEYIILDIKVPSKLSKEEKIYIKS